MALENGDIVFIKLGRSDSMTVFEHYHERFERLKEFLFETKGIRVEFVFYGEFIEKIEVLGAEKSRSKKIKELDEILGEGRKHFRTIRI